MSDCSTFGSAHVENKGLFHIGSSQADSNDKNVRNILKWEQI